MKDKENLIEVFFSGLGTGKGFLVYEDEAGWRIQKSKLNGLEYCGLVTMLNHWFIEDTKKANQAGAKLQSSSPDGFGQ